MKNYKEKKSINDIEIDKESLMQLNRATNQFFAQKVKETIFNSTSTKYFDKKNEMLDFNNFVSKDTFSFSKLIN